MAGDDGTCQAECRVQMIAGGVAERQDWVGIWDAGRGIRKREGGGRNCSRDWGEKADRRWDRDRSWGQEASSRNNIRWDRNMGRWLFGYRGSQGARRRNLRHWGSGGRGLGQGASRHCVGMTS